MEIRRANPADRPAVLELISRVWEDDYIHYCWDEWVEDAAGGVPLVALHEGRLVGIAYIHWLNERVSWHQALRVDPDARRLGIGTALGQACLREARAHGRQLARLLVDADNTPSLRMTARLGFEKVQHWYELAKSDLSDQGPELREPTAAELPLLLRLAESQGERYWHSDWETHDLSLSALQQARAKGCLRVLAAAPPAAVADINIEGDGDCTVGALVGDAIAAKEAMVKHNLQGTVRYYGCPAEETLVGKVFMVRDGLFDDVDISMTWHPGTDNVLWSASSLAMNSAKFTFHGRSSHAAGDPENGRSALDAVELMNVGANYLREHVSTDARIHYVITNGGGEPNVVPPIA
ncbi:MAG: GNAT family N-acetyltransferase [Bacillota bacterium]